MNSSILQLLMGVTANSDVSLLYLLPVYPRSLQIRCLHVSTTMLNMQCRLLTMAWFNSGVSPVTRIVSFIRSVVSAELCVTTVQLSH